MQRKILVMTHNLLLDCGENSAPDCEEHPVGSKTNRLPNFLGPWLH